MLSWLSLLKIFSLFGKEENPVAQAGLWLFASIGFLAFSFFMLVIAFYISHRWYWWAGGSLCGAIGLAAFAVFVRSSRGKRPTLYRPRRDIPPSGRP